MTQPQVGSARAHKLDDFLGHDTRGGGGASFLDNWKKREPPVLKVLLHTKAPIISVYQHPWPKIVTRERDGSDVQEVWSDNFNSWESEDVLQRQYLRDDEGERQFPPQVCPMAIMLEEVERLMREGELPFDTVLFEFKGDDKDYDKYLFAGAITNKAKKLWDPKNKAVTKDMKRKAIKKGFPGPMHVWKTNMMSKCQYVMTVVDYEDVESGIQVTKETTLVGDKLKKVIRDRRTSEGDDEGNPFVNPFVLQFTHKPKADKFDERYDVVAIAKLEVDDEMRKLIFEKEPPSLDRYTAPGDIVALRASMEDHYVGPADLLDWDFIFGKAEAIAGIEQGEEEEPADDEEEAKGEEAESEAEEEAEAEPELPRIIVKRKGKGDDQQCFAEDGVELYGCEKCQAIMRADEVTCYNCGEDYSDEEEADPEPEPEPAPPPARRRSNKNGAAKGKGAGKAKGKVSERAAAKGKDGVGF